MSEEQKLEFEKFEKEAAEKKRQHEKDLLSGKVIAQKTRNPMEESDLSESDPELSGSDSDAEERIRKKALLQNYVPDDLSNNIGKKQKEKIIKNEIDAGYQPPAWSESSESGSDAEIRDPTEYDPLALNPAHLPPEPVYSQHTNPGAVTDAISLAQSAMEKQLRIKKEREIQSRREILNDQKQELIDSVIKHEHPPPPAPHEPPPINFEPEVKPEADIKQEIADSGPLLAPARSVTKSAINSSVNILNPSAGPEYKPKPKPKRNQTNNPIVNNIQRQARSQIPDKPKKGTKSSKNAPVRSFLPNMNPYTHRQRDKDQVDKVPVNQNLENANQIPSTLPPLPVERKRSSNQEMFTKIIPQKKTKQPVADDEWADLPEVNFHIQRMVLTRTHKTGRLKNLKNKDLITICFFKLRSLERPRNF